MSELKRYNVSQPGRRGAVPTVMQLTPEDAKLRGLTDKDLYEKPKTARASGSGSSGSGRRSSAKRGSTPKNKQAAPAGNKSSAPASTAAPAGE